VTNNFIAKADQLFVIKSKEILGWKKIKSCFDIFFRLDINNDK
jgi:hypothetical protein